MPPRLLASRWALAVMDEEQESLAGSAFLRPVRGTGLFNGDRLIGLLALWNWNGARCAIVPRVGVMHVGLHQLSALMSSSLRIFDRPRTSRSRAFCISSSRVSSVSELLPERLLRAEPLLGESPERAFAAR